MMDRQNCNMINATDTVTLCIGGQMFVTRRATLFRLPNSRLFMLATRDHEANNDDKESEEEEGEEPANHIPPVYFFDRDPEIFRFVLDYYRTGELHLPASICGPFVKKELIFWGIDESFILPCCMPAYMRYEEERRIKKTLFKDCFEDISSMQNLVYCSRGFKRWRYTMWLFLDYPSSSLPAKIWASTLLFFMIASVLCFCFSTHTYFRVPSNHAHITPNNLFCHGINATNNSKIISDCYTEPRSELVYVDVALNVLFTIEFLAKVALAPDKKRFLQTFISVLDIVILTSYWIHLWLYYYYYYRYDEKDVQQSNLSLWTLNQISMTQSLRILRIFKVSKISRGLRVLMLTVKKSITELVLLGFLLMNGIFCFSSLIYMAEYQMNDTFLNIPESFWWSIVTLTTVGYGDTFPRSGFGYFIGSIAAISGCIVTGLAIPIIGNNFNTYYKYMQNQLKQDKYLNELGKDMDFPGRITDTVGKPANRKYLKRRGKNKPDKGLGRVGMSGGLKVTHNTNHNFTSPTGQNHTDSGGLAPPPMPMAAQPRKKSMAVVCMGQQPISMQLEEDQEPFVTVLAAHTQQRASMPSNQMDRLITKRHSKTTPGMSRFGRFSHSIHRPEETSDSGAALSESNQNLPTQDPVEMNWMANKKSLPRKNTLCVPTVMLNASHDDPLNGWRKDLHSDVDISDHQPEDGTRACHYV